MVRQRAARDTVLFLFAGLALIRGCHTLVPSMPWDMGLGIIMAITVVITLAVVSDRGRGR